MLEGWKGVGVRVSNICGSGGIGIGVLCAHHSLFVSLHKPAQIRQKVYESAILFFGTHKLL